MADDFDPYQQWLGIPKHKRPMTCYRLLGLKALVDDPTLIAKAAKSRMKAVAQHREGEHAEQCMRILKKLKEAQDCLLDADKKVKYDKMLRKQMAAAQNGTGQAAASAPPKAKVASQPPRSKPVGGNPPKARPTAGRPPKAKPAPPSAQPVDSGVPDFGAFNFSDAPTTTSASSGEESPYQYGRKKKNKWIMPAAVVGGLVIVAGGLFFALSGSGGGEEIAANPDEVEVETKSTPTIDPDDPLAPKDPLATPKPPPADPLDQPEVDTSDPTTPTATTPSPTPNPTPEPEPEPEPVDTEPSEMAWGVLADRAEIAPVPLNSVTFDGIKPSFGPRSWAVDNNRTLCALGAPQDKVEVWDLGAKALKSTCQIPGNTIHSVALVGADRLVVWTDKNGMLLFDPQTGEPSGSPLPIPVVKPELEAKPKCGMVVSTGEHYLALVRKGIRIYRTSDWKLQGIIPVAEGQEVLAIGFHPEGDKLMAVIQAEGPYQFQSVMYDMANGQPRGSNTRPGLLAADDIDGPIEYRLSKEGYHTWCVGDRYILDQFEGRVVWDVNCKTKFAIPLEPGSYWVVDDTGNVQPGKIQWKLLARAFKAFDGGSGVMQLAPGNSIAINVQSDDEEAGAKFRSYLEERFTQEGYKIGGSAETVFKVELTLNGKSKLRAAWFSDEINSELWHWQIGGGAPSNAEQKAALVDQMLERLSSMVIEYFHARGFTGTTRLPGKATKFEATDTSPE